VDHGERPQAYGSFERTGEAGCQRDEAGYRANDALGAADTYFDFLNKTISSFPSGGTEFGEKLKVFAEKNIAATREFIKQLSHAKNFQDVLRIQTEFLQTQMQALGEQATSLAETFTRTAASEVKMPFKTSLE
jgi:hypothetical protein